VIDRVHIRRTVRNNTGEPRYYGFLPPHGKILKPGETCRIDGELPVRTTRAFIEAVATGIVEIIWADVAAECDRQGIDRPRLPSEL